MKLTLTIVKVINKILISRYKSKIKGQELFNYLHKLSIEGKNYGYAGSIEKGGELQTIDLIKDNSQNNIVFDVGSNIGQYQKILLKNLKIDNFTIHCFEPSPDTFEILKKNTADKRVVINNIGLGDKKEKLKLYRNKQFSPLASLYKKEKGDYYNIQNMDEYEEVEINTIDMYCESNNISKINLLKMDVEGHEFNVLKGAQKMIENNSIDYIQFEFGPANIDSKTYFRDFYRLLSDQFDFYRILKDGLYKVNKYSEQEEVFLPVNYLCINKN